MPTSEHQAIQRDIDGDERCAAACTPRAPLAARLWTTRRCLVAPRVETRWAGYAAAVQVSAAAGWPVATRNSGGLTVPNGDGVLNFTIAELCSRPRDPAEHYRRICDLMAEALRRQGAEASVGWVPGAFCDGRYNLVVEGRKLAGAAQRWARRPGEAGIVVIAHALILVDLDVTAAVDAVNGYYAGLQRPLAFSPAAITTLAALGLDGSRFARDLGAAAERLAGRPPDINLHAFQPTGLERT